MTFKQMFISTIGKKFVMALTGIFLITFLIVHAGINACIWANDEGEMFNAAAHFMGSSYVIRIMEIGLFAGIFLHIIQGYLLTLENQKKRPVGYAVSYGNRGSKWYSRSMGILGTLILMFLIIHISHFWVPSRLEGVAGIEGLETKIYPNDPKHYHNLFAEMVEVFRQPWVVVAYTFSVIALCYHLMHGFQSAFRTFGVNNSRYNKMITSIGYGFSIIICLAFAMMPISIHLGWVK